jgi:uncharacterized protein
LTTHTEPEPREPLDNRWAALQDYTTDHDDKATRSGVDHTEES